jgi:hypothetical protein
MTGARLANVHSGCDWWEPSQMLEFFEASQQVEAALQTELKQQQSQLPPLQPFDDSNEVRELGSPFLTHETHRMRALSTPRAAQVVLKAFPSTPLTADLSHWVVGAERTFDFPSDAAWWPTLLEKVNTLCNYFMRVATWYCVYSYSFRHMLLRKLARRHPSQLVLPSLSLFIVQRLPTLLC